MTINTGDAIPGSTFMRMGAEGPEPVTSDDLFTGQKTVLFAVPGAFTPTCSAQHLPGYVREAEALRGKGVDRIACVSVNDVFVMDAWGQSSGAGDIDMLADGNGEFTKAIGLELDASGFGMGSRSQRYAMVVNDGKVEALYVEEGGEFKVSAAEYVLENL